MSPSPPPDYTAVPSFLGGGGWGQGAGRYRLNYRSTPDNQVNTSKSSDQKITLPILYYICILKFYCRKLHTLWPPKRLSKLAKICEVHKQIYIGCLICVLSRLCMAGMAKFEYAEVLARFTWKSSPSLHYTTKGSCPKKIIFCLEIVKRGRGGPNRNQIC